MTANPERARDEAGRPEADDRNMRSQEVIDVFLADTPGQLITLRTLLADRDWEGVQRVAHYLKGSAMCMGFERMRELCQGIEMLTVLNSAQDAGEIVPMLEQELERLRAQFTGGKQKTAGAKAGGQ